MISLTKRFLQKIGCSENEIKGYFQRLEKLRLRIHPNLEILASEEHYIRAKNGTLVFYQVWSPRSTEKIQRIFVCQHGHNVHGDLFYPFADYFSPNSLIISIDNRGHGRSGPAHGDYDKFGASFKIFDYFIRKYHALYPSTPIFLIGESLGSALIVHFLSKNIPNNMLFLTGAILMVAPMKLSMVERISKVKILYYTLLLLLLFMDFLAQHKTILNWPQDFDNPTYLDEFNDFDKHDILRNKRVSLRNVANLLKALAPLQSIAKYIEKPLLILQGTGDKVLNPFGAKILFDRTKSSVKKLVYFKDANHSLFMDKNSQNIYEIIDDWTRKIILNSKGNR